jgi:hypothetical protein
MDSSDQTIHGFIAHPESFTLFRDENAENKSGLHFATDKNWAKNFDTSVLFGSLPAGSRINLLTEEDFENGLKLGITSERPLWDISFNEGYDAVVGYDSVNSEELDVIVNLKHLGYFT